MRNTLIIGALCVIAIAVGVWLYYMHPGPVKTEENAQTAAAGQAVPFQVVDSGTNATGMPSRTDYAIYTSSEFATFWKKVHGGTAPVPAVDFTKDYIIGVFAGTAPTAGYAIKVATVTDTSATRAVDVVIDEPGTGCNVAQKQTSPYEFISVPFSDADTLSHTDEHVTKDCAQ